MSITPICGHDYLLAYSCKTRTFCPSCHQKRVLLYGEWVEENVLEPVPHRQYVFTVPRLLRPVFGSRVSTFSEEARYRAFRCKGLGLLVQFI